MTEAACIHYIDLPARRISNSLTTPTVYQAFEVRAEPVYLNGFELNGSDQLIYTGSAAKDFELCCNWTHATAMVSTYAFRIAVNGTTLAKSQAVEGWLIANFFFPESSGLNCLVNLTPGDTIDYYWTGSGVGGQLTSYGWQMTLTGAPGSAGQTTTTTAYGSLYQSGANTTSLTSGVLSVGTFGTALGVSSNFDMPQNNRLRYTGDFGRLFRFNLRESADCAPNAYYGTQVWRSGQQLVAPQFSEITINDRDDQRNGGTVWMEPNDYLEVYLIPIGTTTHRMHEFGLEVWAV